MIRKAVFLLLALILLSGCNTVPVRSLTSSADARAISDEEDRVWFAAKKFDRSLRDQGLVHPDSQLKHYVQSVADRLYPELAGAVRVHVIRSPHLNAFALGNGSIYINTGLLARLDNEAQLATIMAHEVAHFTEQHNLKHRRSVNTASTAALGITLISGIPLSGQLFAAGAISGYSQSLEREADARGYQRYIAADYAPQESVKAFEHLLAEVETLDIEQPFFFSTHPRLEERIDSFNQLIKEEAGAGSRINAETFLRMTYQLRETVLQDYLAMHQYKTLLQLLSGDAPVARYPEHWPYFLGEAYVQRNEEGDLSRAEQNFKRALQQAPGYAPTYRALGYLQMKQEQSAEALRSFKKYLELEPEAIDRGYMLQYIKTLRDS